MLIRWFIWCNVLWIVECRQKRLLVICLSIYITKTTYHFSRLKKKKKKEMSDIQI